ncbi:MAG: outer-membrane lipoprotein carrier protein LolA [Muribaculaceae bacterium]|nr:outer-membrane lipoprotein carrier protein LolA [Muribaculaceae bacterium]
MKSIRLIFALVFSLTFMAANAMNATQIMDKAANGFKSAGGVSATYTLIGRNIAKQSGSIKVQGNKFAIQHPMLSTWYDGKTLWNYNADSNEVTISNPTASEIQQVNPYALVSNYKSVYTPSLVKSKIKGTHCVLLKAKSSKNAIRQIYLYLNTSNYTPVRLDIVSDGNATTTIVISNYKKGQKFGNTDFVFPSAKYPSASKIDLR